ncbi:ABC transporter ATP-binding protein [Rhodopirellula sallentina]|uniref:ABC transporter ATP binding protein n=1 Tax=Rhodopirellula sallentina SM41 TaxID=1263870 RepID=M5U145_9BACT|nr:ABC transporter ATP-binding protein [Rhodopirellula sallentina]EMI55172.1 ABC transporter ATP binding protein [Rhodopirellula sallentina SM41]
MSDETTIASEGGAAELPDEMQRPDSDPHLSNGDFSGQANSDQRLNQFAAPKNNAAVHPSAGGVHSGTDDCIELRRLYRYFGKTKAVHDISFSVSRGHVFGYIGPNGAGKTTSMRILSTLDLPSYGDAFVDGFSVVNDPELVRRRLGFMPDSFGTYRDVNCEEYLDFFARAYGLVGRERTERLKWVLDFTGTVGMKEKPIRGLSKGMKQRLCLGRALVHDPAVMILDEPAAGLDPRARIQLRKMIRELADRGKTILISSHILTELAEMCDAVGIIEQGQLLATGSVDEIQRQRNQTREITLRVLDRANEAAERLTQLQNDSESTSHVLGEIVIDGELLRFGFEGELRDQAELVAWLVGEGYAVAEVTSHRKSLEDVFLQVTEGLVQ